MSTKERLSAADYLLSSLALGCAVGCGNIWVSYLVGKYGGIFLLMYLVILFAIAVAFDNGIFS